MAKQRDKHFYHFEDKPQKSIQELVNDFTRLARVKEKVQSIPSSPVCFTFKDARQSEINSHFTR